MQLKRAESLDSIFLNSDTSHFDIFFFTVTTVGNITTMVQYTVNPVLFART